MKNIALYSLTIMLLLSFNSNAQQKERIGKDKIRSLKIAFITERLDLSPKEAEDFWPIYNAHEKEIERIRSKERSHTHGTHKNKAELTEKEAEKLIYDILSIEEKRYKEKRDFLKKVKSKISAKKTILLMKAEEDFRRKLFRKYKERHRYRKDTKKKKEPKS